MIFRGKVYDSTGVFSGISVLSLSLSPFIPLCIKNILILISIHFTILLRSTKYVEYTIWQNRTFVIHISFYFGRRIFCTKIWSNPEEVKREENEKGSTSERISRAIRFCVTFTHVKILQCKDIVFSMKFL